MEHTTLFILFLLSTLIIPIRAIFFVFFLICGGLCGFIAALGAPEDLNIPYPKWRKALATPIMFFARCLLLCAGFHWIEVDDRQKTKGQIIVAAPHVSLTDSFFVPSYFLASPISKAGVKDIPIFGASCVALQTIFVDRASKHDGPYARKLVLETINKRAVDTAFPRMVVFPEGTCTDGTCMIQFKKGAFVPGQAVTPVIISYPFTHYNPACAGRVSFVDLSWNV